MGQYNPSDQETYQVIYSQGGETKESPVSVSTPGSDSVTVPRIPSDAKSELLLHTHGDDGRQVSGFLEPSDTDKGIADRRQAPMLFGNKLGDIFKYTPADKPGGSGQMHQLDSSKRGWNSISPQQMERYMINYLVRTINGDAK